MPAGIAAPPHPLKAAGADPPPLKSKPLPPLHPDPQQKAQPATSLLLSIRIQSSCQKAEVMHLTEYAPGRLTMKLVSSLSSDREQANGISWTLTLYMLQHCPPRSAYHLSCRVCACLLHAMLSCLERHPAAFCVFVRVSLCQCFWREARKMPE